MDEELKRAAEICCDRNYDVYDRAKAGNVLARHYLSPPAAGPVFDAEGFVPMTEDRLRKLLGPFYPADPDDAEAMLKQANADPHEGKEWVPRYKAALSLLAMECGYLAGVIDKIRFVASEKGYREELQRRLDVAGEYWQAHLRLVADELPTAPAPNEGGGAGLTRKQQDMEAAS